MVLWSRLTGALITERPSSHAGLQKLDRPAIDGSSKRLGARTGYRCHQRPERKPSTLYMFGYVYISDLMPDIKHATC